MAINIKEVQIKTGNKENLPQLKRGEQALTVDTKEFYVCDGVENIAFPSKEYVDNEIASLNTDVDNLKQSVSDGKGLIATAITDKGVYTVATDTFKKMADNIGNIIGGSGGTYLSVTVIEKGRPVIGEQVVAESDDGDIIYFTTNASGIAVTELEYGNYTVIVKNKIETVNIAKDSVCTILFEFNTFLYGIKIPLSDANPDGGVYIEDCTGFANANNTNLGSWTDTDLINMIKPCTIKEDGTVNYYLDKQNRTKKEDGMPANLTGNDGDVMVEIPKLYWYMHQDSTHQYIYLSNDKLDDNYQCLAHTKGTQELDKIYVSAYLGFNDAGKLRSVSGKSPTVSQTIGVFRTQAQSRTNWQMIDFHTLTLLQILYLMVYKNRDSQTQLGKGYTATTNTAKANTGGTNSKSWCFGYTGTNDGKQQNCFLGIEDFFGNCFYWIDGLFSNANRNILTATQNYNNTGSGYTNQGASGYTADFGGYFTNIQGKNSTGFLPKGDVKGTSSTYYADYAALYASCLPYFGGYWSTGAFAGAFRLNVYFSASASDGDLTARCVYKG